MDLIGTHNLDSMKAKHYAKGGEKHITIKRFKTPEECLDYLIKNRLKIICIENSDGASRLDEFKFPANIALIMGHEGLGVPEVFKNFFVNVKIPQYGLVKCLNTSVATSIILYERFIQKLRI